jgi:hypothetical protein
VVLLLLILVVVLFQVYNAWTGISSYRYTTSTRNTSTSTSTSTTRTSTTLGLQSGVGVGAERRNATIPVDTNPLVNNSAAPVVVNSSVAAVNINININITLNLTRESGVANNNNNNNNTNTDSGPARPRSHDAVASTENTENTANTERSSTVRVRPPLGNNENSTSPMMVSTSTTPSSQRVVVMTENAINNITITNKTLNNNYNYNNNSSSNFYYSVARYDRSGAVIGDMLRAHAYAYANHQTYAGACVCCQRKARARQRRAPTEAVLADLGLDTIFKYACPDDLNLVSTAHRADGNTANSAAELYNPEWKEFFLSQWGDEERHDRHNHQHQHQHHHDGPPFENHNNNNNNNNTTPRENGPKNETIVAVHIRRGDVNPCRYPARYKPNSHYLRLIDEYIITTQQQQQQQQQQDPLLPPPRPVPKVYIYSESKSFEPFDEFVRRNYTMILDTDLPGVLHAIMTADVVITSVSSFSYVPAVLNYKNGTIIHTPGGHPPLLLNKNNNNNNNTIYNNKWILVNSTFMAQTGTELQEVRKACWGGNKQAGGRGGNTTTTTTTTTANNNTNNNTNETA